MGGAAGPVEGVAVKSHRATALRDTRLLLSLVFSLFRARLAILGYPRKLGQEGCVLVLTQRT